MSLTTDTPGDTPPQTSRLEDIFPPEYISADRGPVAEGVAWSFLFLQIVFVILRFVSRRHIKAKLGLDDWLILPGLLFCVGMCIVTITMVHVTGMGKHLPVVAMKKPENIPAWAKGGYAIECIHSLAVVFPRLSILASYMRIFILRRYRYPTYALGLVIVANSIAGITVSLSQCRPFSARWSGPEAMATHCINSMPIFRWLVLVNMIIDVIMLVLPIPVLWRLNISVRERIALVFIFALGSIGFITSTIRFTIFFKVKELSTDGTWLSTDLAIWSTIEAGIYLIAACLPPLRPLFLKFLNVARAQTKWSGNRSRTGYVNSGSEGVREGQKINQTAEIRLERRKRTSEISDEEIMLQQQTFPR